MSTNANDTDNGTDSLNQRLEDDADAIDANAADARRLRIAREFLLYETTQRRSVLDFPTAKLTPSGLLCVTDGGSEYLTTDYAVKLEDAR